MGRPSFIFIAALCLGCAPAWAGPMSYVFATLDVPGATSIAAQGINDKGQIVGTFFSQTDGNQGFIYSAGTFTPIIVPGVTTDAYSINNAGVVVGTNFIYENGNLSTFGAPGNFSLLTGINNEGQIVGETNGIPYLYSGGTSTQLNAFSQALGINDAGQIVGWTGHSLGLLDTGGVLTTFQVPGGVGTVAYDINDHGVIVGDYYDCLSGCPERGFVLSNGVFTTVDAPGAGPGGTGVEGINNKGDIVGFFYNAEGETEGFVAIPAPEPITVSVFGAGIAGAVAMRRRKNAKSSRLE